MNNDLISREALKKAFKIEELYWGKRIIDIIDNAPTINTTCPNCDSGYAQGYSDGYLKGKEDRPHGKWIYNGFSYRCSKCGKSPKTLGFCGSTIFMEENFKFCPNCGAKMDKEAEA